MPREKVLNKNLWEAYESAIPLKFYSEYHRAVNEQVSVHFEEYFPPLERWFDVTAYPSTNGLSVFFKDITDRVNIQKEIKESKERYDIIAKATNDIIWDWDLLTDEVICNNSFKSILGYKTTEGRTSSTWWLENVHPDDYERVKESIFKVIEKPGKWKEEYRFKCADNSYKYFLDRAFLLKDATGRPVRMIGSKQDISQLKLKEKEIEERNQRILEIAHSNSHLVRKPLANILGIIDLLEENTNSELLKMLKDSAVELDSILKEVAHKTCRQI
jgi:PAS domain S-box-containing protein